LVGDGDDTEVFHLVCGRLFFGKRIVPNLRLGGYELINLAERKDIWDYPEYIVQRRRKGRTESNFKTRYTGQFRLCCYWTTPCLFKEMQNKQNTPCRDLGTHGISTTVFPAARFFFKQKAKDPALYIKPERQHIVQTTSQHNGSAN
jgi:hypothetical protein